VDAPFDILLVDDDEVDRAAARRALRAAGVEACIVEAGDATEALQLLAERSFDCVLLDFRLPRSDGLAVLQEARRRGISSPMVLLTGQGDEATAVAIMKAGAADYIVKSALSPERLAQSVRQAIRLGRAEKRAHEAQREADTQRLRLQSLFMQAPVAIAMFEGAEHRCVLANSTYREVLGQRELLGRSLRESAPDLEGQGIFEILDHVFATQETQSVTGQTVRFERANGLADEHFFDTTWQATKDSAGLSVGVMSIGVEVTDQVLARRERERLYDNAQRAIRSRDDLLATVSHDLRSPLSTVVMATAVLRKFGTGSTDSAGTIARSTAVIERAAEQMARLIRDLLDLAAIEAGHLSMEMHPQEADALLTEAADLAAPLAQAKGVALAAECGAPGARVLCDRDRIAQVFSNLIGNAIKFTPANGAISVASTTREGMVSFRISDTGPGIAAAELPRVFDRFWQAPAHSKAGTGLGLAICQGIIAQHGSVIRVESVLGVGTTFSFTLDAIE
jgi:signal transduction histidine kinase